MFSSAQGGVEKFMAQRAKIYEEDGEVKRWSFVGVLAMCVALLVGSDLFAQCRNGVCPTAGSRVVAGVVNAVAIPVQAVREIRTIGVASEGCSTCVTSAVADTSGDFGALVFARKLDRSRFLYHDRYFNGPEVVFKSSGVATQEMAVAAWLKSKKGHRELLQSGAITAIRCSGSACVGRGAPLAKAAVASVAGVATGVARRAVRPLRCLKNRLCR